MIHRLKLVNLPAEGIFPANTTGRHFILRTCQRILVLSFDPLDLLYTSLPEIGAEGSIQHHPKTAPLEVESYSGPEAYRFLLEVICGLRSQLLGEHEITHQFRQSFQEFLLLRQKNSDLIFILEKLLKDSKEIRHRYLTNVGQQSYAGITRQILNRHAHRQGVLILGSGTMARDLINILRKRYQIHLCARDEAKVKEYCQEFGLIALPWKNDEMLAQFPAIINTIGDEQTILWNHDFFEVWLKGHLPKKIFIDLGAPSVIRTSFGKNENLYRLQDIFEEGVTLNQQKEEKVARARIAIRKMMLTRAISLADDYLNFGRSCNLLPMESGAHQ
ncbi:MAG: hypothetical protein WCG27_02875 [Pseudomonadota bacterium]